MSKTKWMICATLAVGFALGNGCGSPVSPGSDASVGPTYDAASWDAGAAADAQLDAGVPDAMTAAREGAELTGTGGQITGGGMRLDVQLGHWFGQGPASAGNNTVEGAAMVK